MNAERRKRIAAFADKVQALADELEEIDNEEYEAREAIPEALQQGATYEGSEQDSEHLQQALDALNDCISALGEISA